MAAENLTYSDKKDAVRVIAVNALPDRPSVDVLDETDDPKTVLVDALPYGEASTMFEVDKGTHTIGLYADGNDRNRLVALKDKAFDANTSVLWVFTEERQADNSFTDVVINLETASSPSFGSPTLVGQLLFTQYVLPFEMVALLLSRGDDRCDCADARNAGPAPPDGSPSGKSARRFGAADCRGIR